MTKLGAILGSPIGHSLSPAMYNSAFPVMGIDATYEAWQVAEAGVEAALERLRGEEMLCMNVTVPDKEKAAQLLGASSRDALDDIATKIGAVNCISKEGDRLIGHNTDQYGFMRSLEEALAKEGAQLEGMRALVLGYRGSARAITYALARKPVASIKIAGRNMEGVSGLAEEASRWSSDIPVSTAGWSEAALIQACETADLVVNCTPVGMRGGEMPDQSPLPEAALRPGLWVYDLVFNPRQTRLLTLAEAAGCYPVGGLEMLVYQAEQSIYHWCGRYGPVDVLMEACLEKLAERDREVQE
jgi:shikimate dehydrogenase